MKKKKKIIIIISCIILSIIFSNCIGYETLPWKTVEYYSIGKVGYLDVNDYRKAMYYCPESCWNDLLIDVRTGDQNNYYFKTTYPLKITFNILSCFEQESSFSINQISLKNIDGKELKLYMNESFPINLSFKQFGNDESSLYEASFSTDYAYYFKGRQHELYFIYIELQNNETKEVKSFNLVLKPHVERGFGYWRY